MLLQQDGVCRERKIANAGMTISALSCHGNALHPDKEISAKHAETSRKTVLLAEKLGVNTVVDFSGCPGDSPNARFPNWVTCPWPPDFLDVLNWQWDQVVTPYWKTHGKFAADHGVKIAIEMHPGFVVYNPETMLKLRAIAGPSVGANLDPSHLMWQGADPSAAARALGAAIHHVHLKDTEIVGDRAAVSGLLEYNSFDQPDLRSWNFRTIGQGHDATWWSGFLVALREAGYDGSLSIENEDPYQGAAEGVLEAAAFITPMINAQ